MKTLIIFIPTWIILQISANEVGASDIMPYLDKIGTVGLALMIAYMMYKEMLRRDRDARIAEKEMRAEFKLKEDGWIKDRAELTEQLLERIDNAGFRANDILKQMQKQIEKNNQNQ